MPAELDATVVTHEHPTGFHRYVKRLEAGDVSASGPGVRILRIHQQEWAILTWSDGAPRTRHTEWRDVPLVEE